MKYTFETLYNQEALTIMAKCLRKTVRRKKSTRSHILGWIVVILAILLSFVSDTENFVIDFKKVITWIAALAIIVSFIFEDWLNGYFARKRMLRGMVMYREILESYAKENKWVQIQPPAQMQDIKKAEEYVGHPFPDELVNLLLELNGDKWLR